MKPIFSRDDPLAPWARAALSSADQRAVRESGVSLSGKSARGPWIAWGPAGRIVDSDIRRAVNRAAGEDVFHA